MTAWSFLFENEVESVEMINSFLGSDLYGIDVEYVYFNRSALCETTVKFRDRVFSLRRDHNRLLGCCDLISPQIFSFLIGSETCS